MVDTLSMLDAALALPEQFIRAVDAESPLGAVVGGDGSTVPNSTVPNSTAPNSTAPNSTARISTVLISGMGGSGIVGDIANSIAGPTSRVPIVVSKSEECPAFVGPGTLVIVSSFSGETAETISVMEAALAAGSMVVAVTAGGPIGEMAQRAGVPLWRIEDGIPCPRSGLAALAVPVLRTLDHYGICDPLQGGLASTVKQLMARRDELARPDNAALRLARKIGRTLPLIYGAGAIGATTAVRWKSQFNENPKIPAFTAVIPELTHNEICGWAQHGDMTRQVFTLLQLRHDFETVRSAMAMDMVAEITEEVVGAVHSVNAAGDGPLAQLFDLVLFGDLVSLHMALNEGIDPGPVPVMDDLKARLRS